MSKESILSSIHDSRYQSIYFQIVGIAYWSQHDYIVQQFNSTFINTTYHYIFNNDDSNTVIMECKNNFYLIQSFHQLFSITIAMISILQFYIQYGQSHLDLINFHHHCQDSRLDLPIWIKIN